MLWLHRNDYIFSLLCLLNVNMGALDLSRAKEKENRLITHSMFACVYVRILCYERCLLLWLGGCRWKQKWKKYEMTAIKHFLIWIIDDVVVLHVCMYRTFELTYLTAILYLLLLLVWWRPITLIRCSMN